MRLGQSYTISAGYGYEDVTRGFADFRRAGADGLAVTVTRDFRREGLTMRDTKGYTHAGRTADGKTVNFKARDMEVPA
jgi:hypothetical protein